MSEANGATNDTRKGGESGDFFALPFCVVSGAFCVGAWSNGAEQGLKARAVWRVSVQRTMPQCHDAFIPCVVELRNATAQKEKAKKTQKI